jgi:hypothetical protein
MHSPLKAAGAQRLCGAQVAAVMHHAALLRERQDPYLRVAGRRRPPLAHIQGGQQFNDEKFVAKS